MSWPSPISSRTLKPTCGAISNTSPASPSGCSWPIQPPAPPSAPRLDPGWSGKFSHSCHGGSGCTCPSGAALASTHRTALQADAWLLGCAGCGDVGPAESCGNDFLLIRTSCDSAFGHALQPQTECPHCGRLGCAQPWTASAPHFGSLRFLSLWAGYG